MPRCCGFATSCCRSSRLSSLLKLDGSKAIPGKGLHRRHPRRRADLRRRGGQRVPHRGNRGQADGEQAPPHRHVLRQHHPRRRLGDHDHRPQRRVAGDRHLGRRRPRRLTPAPRPSAMSPKTPCRCSCSAPAPPEPKAVPLSLVTRLEEIDCKKIELSNGRHMVQYRGQLMPLIRVSDEVKIKREGAQPLLVFSDGNRSMGLVVDEIVDIVEEKLDIEVGSDRVRRAWLRRGARPGHRNHRRRPFPAARLCRLVPRQGACRYRTRSARFSWSTTRRSSATCCRRFSRPLATK